MNQSKPKKSKEKKDKENPRHKEDFENLFDDSISNKEANRKKIE